MGERDAWQSVSTILGLDTIGAHSLGSIEELISPTSHTVQSVAHCK